MAQSYVTTVTLIELLHKIESGGILTPNFNRGFVWGKPEIKSLFESIYLGYPIGMILAVTGVSDDYIPSHPESSHFPVQKDALNSSGPILWVIDGSQRLAALYSVLRESSLGIDLYFDLVEKIFIYNPKEKNRLATIKMSSLFDYKSFIDFQDGLLSSDLHSKLMPEINSLHSRFQNYQVVLQVMNVSDRNEVANVFARINMYGRSLSKNEILKARRYKGTIK